MAPIITGFLVYRKEVYDLNPMSTDAIYGLWDNLPWYRKALYNERARQLCIIFDKGEV